MDGYISREDAISHPFANGNYDHDHANQDFIMGHESYREWLEQIPAADVVEVVRCKNCRFSETSSIIPSLIICTAANGLVDPSPMCFCSFEERRTEDE